MKRMASVILIAVLMLSLAACGGTDYKQLGYDTAKSACDEIDAELRESYDSDAEYSFAIGLWIAFAGEQSFIDSIREAANKKAEDGGINVPESELENWNAGIDEAAAEWLSNFK